MDNIIACNKISESLPHITILSSYCTDAGESTFVFVFFGVVVVVFVFVFVVVVVVVVVVGERERDGEGVDEMSGGVERGSVEASERGSVFSFICTFSFSFSIIIAKFFSNFVSPSISVISVISVLELISVFSDFSVFPDIFECNIASRLAATVLRK